MPSRKVRLLGSILPHRATREKAQNFLVRRRSIVEVHSGRGMRFIVRYFDGGAWLLFSVLVFSCHKGGGGAKGEGAIEVIDVESPVGLDGPAVSRCDRDGNKCSSIGKSDAIPPGTLVKTARGARAALALGPAANLDLGEESSVFLDSASS